MKTDVVTPTYLPRSWWADSSWSRGGAQLVDDDLWRLGNVCHYPGRASAFGIMSLANLRSNLRGWWNFHVNTRGWSDIGYQTCVSMTTQGPVVVDLRGIGRVPAAHASASNPRANWHGGATLWTIGNTEPIHPDLIDAYRHFRHTVWLKRWPTAKGVTHHRRVPGASTSCAGDRMDQLVRTGALLTTSTNPEEDDMFTDADRARLERLESVITSFSDEKVGRPDAEGTAGMRFALQETWHDTHELTEKVPWESPGVHDYVRDVLGWKEADDPTKARPQTTRYLIEWAFVNADRIWKIVSDPSKLAQELAPLLPSGSAPTPEQLEAALRNVLGSLDNVPA